MTMSQMNSLFIVQSSYNRLKDSLNELAALQQASDAILLMEDAVFAIHHPDIETLQHLHILESDAHLIAPSCKVPITIIHYTQFAALIAQATKVITWK